VIAHRADAIPTGDSFDVHPCLHPTGIDSDEPTIGVTEDGAIFTNGFVSGPEEVVRSTDGAQTWKRVSPRPFGQSSHPGSADPYLYVDKRTSRLFMVDYGFACSVISFSDDRGKSWANSLAGCGQGDHESLFAGPPVTSRPRGYPNVVYYCAVTGGISIIGLSSACSKSLDGGRTFIPTGLPAFQDDPRQPTGDQGIRGMCDGFHGHGVVSADGTVYLPRGWCGQPWLAISKNEGLTWRRVQVAANGMTVSEAGSRGHEAGVAVDGNGFLYYVWTARNRLPYLAISRNGGATWSSPMMIAAPGVKEATMPGIDVGADGRIAIVYLGSTDSPGRPFIERPLCLRDLVGCAIAGMHDVFNAYEVGVTVDREISKRYRDTTWNGYITISLDPLVPNPLLLSASVNDPQDPLARGLCGPDPNRCGVGDFFDIVVAPDGTPWASMVDSCVDTCVHPQSNADKHGDAERGMVARFIGL
jgi:hypothetical protein